jgi:hypothetical protein
MVKYKKWLILLAGWFIFLTPLSRADLASPSQNLSQSELDSVFPKVVRVPGTSTLLVCWIETNGTCDFLYFIKSTDGGNSWGKPKMLSLTGQIQENDESGGDLGNYYALAMAVQAPYVHIVIQWRSNESDDFEIRYRRSVDLGDTWDSWRQLTDNATDSRFPDVFARGTYVHVAYQDSWPGNEEIMYKRISDNGGGAIDSTRRLTNSSSESFYPRIAASLDGALISVVYEDNMAGAFNIYLKSLGSAGTGTLYTRRLTFGTDPYSGWNGLPDIATSSAGAPDDEYVYLVYQTLWPGNMEIMYKRLDNYGLASGGTTYTARLTYSTADSHSNAIDFDSVTNDIHISYHDFWPGNNDVMYRKLANLGGGGFTGQRVSWGTGDSSQSSVAASSGDAYVVWADNTSGNYEIYIK